MEYQLQNRELTVTVGSHGAELLSIKENKNEKEYMWQADPAFWGRTSPVLFPFVGALKEGQYRYHGQTYPMGQHGFARDREFEMISCSEDRIDFVLRADAQSKEIYPFDFELKIAYILEGKRISVCWDVRNTGSHEMYFSIGAHPAFLYPKGQMPYLLFDSDAVSYRLLEQGLAAEKRYSLPMENGRYRVRENTFDQDALVVEGGQNHCVKLADAQGTPYLQVVFESPLYGLWSPAGKHAPFLCIEPWWGRCDSTAFQGELEMREFSNTVAPGNVFQAGYQIEILE